MANVDPFIIQWPEKWTTDPEIAPAINYLNLFLHDMFIRSGGGEDLLETSQAFNKKSLAGIIEINEKIGSGNPLTFDETGFTWDSDRLSFDQDEA